MDTHTRTHTLVGNAWTDTHTPNTRGHSSHRQEVAISVSYICSTGVKGLDIPKELQEKLTWVHMSLQACPWGTCSWRCISLAVQEDSLNSQL